MLCFKGNLWDGLWGQSSFPSSDDHHQDPSCDGHLMASMLQQMVVIIAGNQMAWGT